MRASLLAAVAAGDESAFRQLLQRDLPMFNRLAQRYGCRDIDDAIQDILLAVWCAAHRFDGRASERAFVATIARRRLIDRHRHERRRPRLSAADHNSLETLYPPSGSQRMEARAELSMLRETLGELPAKRLRALVMSACEEMTHREIADALGVPLGTAKTHARRAVMEARRRLEPDAAQLAVV